MRRMLARENFTSGRRRRAISLSMLKVPFDCLELKWNFRDGGGGGGVTHSLISQVVLPFFYNPLFLTFQCRFLKQNVFIVFLSFTVCAHFRWFLSAVKKYGK